MQLNLVTFGHLVNACMNRNRNRSSVLLFLVTVALVQNGQLGIIEIVLDEKIRLHVVHMPLISPFESRVNPSSCFLLIVTPNKTKK